MSRPDDWCGDSPWGVHGELPCDYCGATEETDQGERLEPDSDGGFTIPASGVYWASVVLTRP